MTPAISVTGLNRHYHGHLALDQVRHALRVASWFYPHWSPELADALLADFGLPPGRAIKKLSRGMRSALGIVIGLAARADVTLFDEPYAGLDAVARQIFYDRLLAEYAEHPRTILLSTHPAVRLGHVVRDRLPALEPVRLGDLHRRPGHRAGRGGADPRLGGCVVGRRSLHPRRHRLTGPAVDPPSRSRPAVDPRPAAVRLPHGLPSCRPDPGGSGIRGRAASL
jgi:hypothetical protein